jgi:hypothetical protein
MGFMYAKNLIFFCSFLPTKRMPSRENANYDLEIPTSRTKSERNTKHQRFWGFRVGFAPKQCDKNAKEKFATFESEPIFSGPPSESLNLKFPLSGGLSFVCTTLIRFLCTSLEGFPGNLDFPIVEKMHFILFF